MAPRKAAKKVAGKHDPNKAAKDLRRTFEHLGRVQALTRLTEVERPTLTALTSISDVAFRAAGYQASADLLRAAEHLSFATIQADAKESVSPELERTIEEEIKHLSERAKERAAEHSVSKAVKPYLERFSRDARQALQRGSYRAALEFARGAEALAHVQEAEEKSLPPTAPKAQLRG